MLSKARTTEVLGSTHRRHYDAADCYGRSSWHESLRAVAYGRDSVDMLTFGCRNETEQTTHGGGAIPEICRLHGEAIPRNTLRLVGALKIVDLLTVQFPLFGSICREHPPQVELDDRVRRIHIAVIHPTLHRIHRQEPPAVDEPIPVTPTVTSLTPVEESPFAGHSGQCGVGTCQETDPPKVLRHELIETER